MKDEIWPGMPRAEFDDIREYVHELQEELGLHSWDVAVRTHPCDDDADAKIFPTDDRRVATVELKQDFLQDTPEEQRYAIVHELLHCQTTFQLMDALHAVASPHLASPVMQSIRNIVHHEAELTTDALTVVIAPYLPLR
jgi:hypothetical protein